MIQEHAFVPGLPAPTRSGDGAYISVRLLTTRRGASGATAGGQSQEGRWHIGCSRAAGQAEGSGPVGLTHQGGKEILTRREGGSISMRDARQL